MLIAGWVSSSSATYFGNSDTYGAESLKFYGYLNNGTIPNTEMIDFQITSVTLSVYCEEVATSRYKGDVYLGTSATSSMYLGTTPYKQGDDAGRITWTSTLTQTPNVTLSTLAGLSADSINFYLTNCKSDKTGRKIYCKSSWSATTLRINYSYSDNQPPNSPTVYAPVNYASTVATRPYFRVNPGTDPNGDGVYIGVAMYDHTAGSWIQSTVWYGGSYTSAYTYKIRSDSSIRAGYTDDEEIPEHRTYNHLIQINFYEMDSRGLEADSTTIRWAYAYPGHLYGSSKKIDIDSLIDIRIYTQWLCGWYNKTLPTYSTTKSEIIETAPASVSDITELATYIASTNYGQAALDSAGYVAPTRGNLFEAGDSGSGLAPECIYQLHDALTDYA